MLKIRTITRTIEIGQQELALFDKGTVPPSWKYRPPSTEIVRAIARPSRPGSPFPPRTIQGEAAPYVARDDSVTLYGSFLRQGGMVILLPPELSLWGHLTMGPVRIFNVG